METIYEGLVRGGAIVLDPGVLALPEGSRVRVKVEPVDVSGAAEGFNFLSTLANQAEPTGIPDLATNIDHYLYGHPKVSDAPE